MKTTTIVLSTNCSIRTKSIQKKVFQSSMLVLFNDHTCLKLINVAIMCIWTFSSNLLTVVQSHFKTSGSTIVVNFGSSL